MKTKFFENSNFPNYHYSNFPSKYIFKKSRTKIPNKIFSFLFIFQEKSFILTIF